ncbi:MAG: cyclodeaminase/cyclohydrolase family protein [Solirubrobacterales bacterium]
MTDPLDLDISAFLDAVSDPEDPIASSVLAAQTVAATAALLTMAARATGGSEASGLAAQCESVRARATGLIRTCAQNYAEAAKLLRERSERSERGVRGARGADGGSERDFLLGRALHRAAEAPAAVAEAAGDVALLAQALAEGCEPDRIPDVRAACALAEGAARACVGLVEINLVAGGDEALGAQAERGAELAAEARRRLAID